MFGQYTLGNWTTALIKYVFDVDGTLTPSRQTMDPEFKKWFLDFIKTNKVWLVTGSDYPKTVEQLGKDITESVVTCYNCSGNDVWFKGKRANSKTFDMPDRLRSMLEDHLKLSEFPLRKGNHIEERNGTVNFSIVGRNCTLGERMLYVKYDTSNKERHSIASEINLEFPDVTASVGGETGIDIYRKGADKSQILYDFNSDDTIHFFGDRMEPGGNDHSLALALNFKDCFHTQNWQHTWELLQKNM